VKNIPPITAQLIVGRVDDAVVAAASSPALPPAGYATPRASIWAATYKPPTITTMAPVNPHSKR
jgi:hypothetical protein